MDGQQLNVIFRKYGDFLYQKAEYDSAMQQYLKAIDNTEPSQVIRKVRKTWLIFGHILTDPVSWYTTYTQSDWIPWGITRASQSDCRSHNIVTELLRQTERYRQVGEVHQISWRSKIWSWYCNLYVQTRWLLSAGSLSCYEAWWARISSWYFDRGLEEI